MEFNELYEKFISDSSFEREVASITEGSSYDEFAKKYDIPYSLEELRNLANDKAETTNCSIDTRTFSKCTYEELNTQISRHQHICNHPLIVTWGNTCKLSSDTCFNCQNGTFQRFGAVTYCIERSREWDPCL